MPWMGYLARTAIPELSILGGLNKTARFFIPILLTHDFQVYINPTAFGHFLLFCEIFSTKLVGYCRSAIAALFLTS